jgi:hypothetical protein
MSNSKISAAAFADTKPHYDLLDGLRGVAALMVIFYHVFEAFATSPIDQQFNHGYLAVDFFFILSGFVIGYAYDDRWKTMTTKDFIKRRLIRLHPMVVLGAVLGVIAFYIQGCEKWDGTHVSISMVMLALLINLFLIPAVPGSGPEIRGNGEMFPLNGPSWSLFFEYIGNIMYALFIRRMSTKALTALIVLAGIGLASFAIFNFSGAGHLGVGWTMEREREQGSDRQGDVLDNFFKNFFRQCKEPSRFGFYRIAADQVDSMLGVMKDLLQHPYQNKQILAPHKIDTFPYQQQVQEEMAAQKTEKQEPQKQENMDIETCVPSHFSHPCI